MTTIEALTVHLSQVRAVASAAMRCPTSFLRAVHTSRTPPPTHPTLQVHKETLKGVPNAREGRDDISVQVFGMDGVPEELLVPAGGVKRQRVSGRDDDDEPALPPLPPAPSGAGAAAAYAPPPPPHYAPPPYGHHAPPYGYAPPLPYGHHHAPPPYGYFPPAHPPYPGAHPHHHHMMMHAPPPPPHQYPPPPPGWQAVQGVVPGVGGAAPPPGGAAVAAAAAADEGFGRMVLPSSVGAGAGAGAAGVGAGAGAAAGPTTQLVWSNEALSMEEVRALGPRYAKTVLDTTHADLEARLAAALG